MEERELQELAEAIFVINRHAKTAPDPRFLYALKKKAIEKLLEEGCAKKLGLHYSPVSAKNKKRSDVLVQVGKYYFHTPLTPEDKNLPHLGFRDDAFRNPKPTISRTKAIQLLEAFTGISKKDFAPSAREIAFGRFLIHEKRKY